MKQRIAWFCQACHNHVHALFTEKTLERGFNTLEALSSHPEVARFTSRKKYWTHEWTHGLFLQSFRS